MNNNLVIADVDGVLADFEKAFCQKFGWQHREYHSLELRCHPIERESVSLFVSLSSTYSRLDIVPLGCEIAKFLDEQGHTVDLLSSRPIWTQLVTELWLEQNKIPYSSLEVLGQDKGKLKAIYKADPWFIVDDSWYVCEKAAAMGIPALLIDSPWNQTDVKIDRLYRVKSFEQFREIYDQFSEILSHF